MPISDYMRGLRALVGTRLLLVPAVSAVIRDDGGRVLLMQKAESGRWSLPAGGIDPGETPEAAVVRETAEETGLVVTATRLLTVLGGERYRMHYGNGDAVEFTICVFACEVAPGTPEAVDGEALGFQWVEPEAVAGRLDLPYPAVLFVGNGADGVPDKAASENRT
jgi:8-oxo-dGTP pyrophosphatase MutT (NUDIX family)